jgi:KaiC/GvpD/RAD55 family RecA-like ATPase
MDFKTGIDGLDEMFGGGLPMPSAGVLMGEALIPKRLLAMQLAWNALNSGFKVLYYATDNPVSEIKEVMASYNWDLTDYEEEKRIRFVDIFSKAMNTVHTLVDRKGEFIEHTISKTFNFSDILRDGRRFFVESIVNSGLFVVFDSLSSVFGMMEYQDVVKFLYALKYSTRLSRSLGIGIVHADAIEERALGQLKIIADFILEMRLRESRIESQKFVKVLKSKTKYDPMPYSMNITTSGVVFRRVIPT